MTLFAATSWPDAAIAMAGIGFVTVVIAVATWQIFATGRAGLSAKRETAYRSLAERVEQAQLDTATELRRVAASLEQLAERAGELERGVGELDRVLKAVE